MAYNPISGFTLQVITQTGEVASDYHLKFYEANTTTPLSMATDSAGGTLLVKAKLSDSGFPISNPLDNSTVFIPHMNANYRLVVYLNEADADANATGSAYVNIPNVSTMVGSSAIGTVAALDTGTAAGEVPTNTDLTTVLAPYLGRNLLINADFSINQEAVSGTVVLLAGAYGHDMFKAGAGGCTYTFATSAGVTTVTITAGTLLQIIEATALPASDVILSWTGTAQGRIDSGSYNDSGLVTDTTTGGTNVTVEFDDGTLSHPQLERGVAVTDFEHVNPADQLVRCHRHYIDMLAGDYTTDNPVFDVSIWSATLGFGTYNHPSVMRASPILKISSAAHFSIFSAGTSSSLTGMVRSNGTPTTSEFTITGSGLTTGYSGWIRTNSTSARCALDARL